ncbi:MAG: bifunctional heptose 7-phosphate kinase/heptose 1-phosphate adenyltransferase, partial [Bryobacteraceae bacterium]
PGTLFMTPAEILKSFPDLSALVVGDICLDRWCTYDPAAAEASRETEIPRVGVVGTAVTPGAGGTVANNLAALGVGRVNVLGAIGEDGFGYELVRALGDKGISAELAIRSPKLQTFTYTKLINLQTGEEDLPRVDFIVSEPLPKDVESQLMQNLELGFTAFDVILVSDQAETESGGVVTPRMRAKLAELALKAPGKIVWVDSRKRTELFRDVILKPNRDEAESACTRQFGMIDYQKLRRHARAPLLVITQGSEGVLVIGEEGERLVRTRRVDRPVDICGAGDSFSAGAAMALASGASPFEAARFGNLVTSITIMKKGTGTASPEEVLAAEAGWLNDDTCD